MDSHVWNLIIGDSKSLNLMIENAKRSRKNSSCIFIGGENKRAENNKPLLIEHKSNK